MLKKLKRILKASALLAMSVLNMGSYSLVFVFPDEPKVVDRAK